MSNRRAHLERHLSDEELRDAIKKADDRRVVRRLCFVRNLYAGDTIEEAAWRVGATQGIGSQWLERWNERAQDGLIPSFGGGQPPKLSHQQARDLQRLLEEGQPWTTAEITQLIEDEFNVSYHPGSIQRMLRNTYRMSYAIPRPETPSRPENAEQLLAERLEEALGETADDSLEEAADPGETVLGFFRRIMADADG
jgi:transposase